MTNTKKIDYTAYEYLTLKVPSDKEAFYIDCYETFGWSYISTITNGLIDKEDYYLNNPHLNKKTLVTLQFKRDRKIPNKAKLTTLQLKCENSLKKLEHLEKEPTTKGTMYALIISIIGTIIFTISFISPYLILKVIAIPIGIILSLLGYPTYLYVKEHLRSKNAPLIEEEYNKISNFCEKAANILQ